VTDDHNADARLVREARDSVWGDHRAFDQLVQRHLAHVRANCEHITGSRTDAEDLTQEVFVKAFFALSELSEDVKFRGWISRIKVNHCLDHLRRVRGRKGVDIDQVLAEHDPGLSIPPPQDRDWDVLERRHRVRRILHRLPESLRIPVILCDMDGFSYQEVADMLGLGLSATKMRIKRGREMFRHYYQQGRTAESADRRSGSASKKES